MSLLPVQRNVARGETSQEGPSVSTPTKKKWSNLMPLLIALVVIAEIAFLGWLDVAKNVDVVNWWTDSFYSTAASRELEVGVDDIGLGGLESYSCEEWLEKEDAVPYSRDFQKEPILVFGAEQEWRTCSVGCKFEYNSNFKFDAAFGLPQPEGTASILRSMESPQYYSENNIDFARRWVSTVWKDLMHIQLLTILPVVQAIRLLTYFLRDEHSLYHRRGYNIVMATSLSSDVPVGYFSWAEYDIMAPVQPKTESAIAAAFISNCAARNFRLQAFEGLEKENIKIDSYGGCHRNHDGRVDKVETLKRYKFSLAFENSNEEDYVTEKFFQSLVADFAPSPGSLLHIKDLKDVVSVAKTMKYLSEHPDAYNQSLRWKYEGPSNSFKALVDMAAVHSSCRLCIHLAAAIREKEEKSPGFQKRPCKCTRGSETVYHLYIRERGSFNMESIFLRSGSLTLEALQSAVYKRFKSLNHVPIWKEERPESIRGDNELQIYRIYPVGLTQRQALHTFKFKNDAELRSHIENNPCA